MSKDQNGVPERPPYVTPKLLKLGTFKDLTRAVGMVGSNDGGKPGKGRPTRTR